MSRSERQTLAGADSGSLAGSKVGIVLYCRTDKPRRTGHSSNLLHIAEVSKNEYPVRRDCGKSHTAKPSNHASIAIHARTPTAISTPASRSPTSQLPTTPACLVIRRWPYKRKIHVDRLIKQFCSIERFDRGAGFGECRIFNQCISL